MPTSMFVRFFISKNKNIVDGVTVQNCVRWDFAWKYSTIYSGY